MSVPGGSSAVFLDRDGVLVRAYAGPGAPRSAATPDELELLSDAAGACAALKGAGYTLVMVTNQPEIARGTLGADVVARQNDALRDTLPLDDVVVCPHDDADGCECRKPKPGMLLGAGERLGLDLEASFMVGDRWRDVEAGRSAGCRVVFVDRGYDERLLSAPDVVVSGVGAAAQWILWHSAAGRDD
jgi:D-glycero-D-manno-heptose 1,7-bisphosphate phosphatase